ncbi:LLM class flavin-dependent oxidoreductase [Candidatus Poriferisodalis sp.]|uniref:LLM class flavin-dependent oxidoreductase n=1 Tax=Candidatus Poriferisodalis sp. TaxID=3101277 RepID=UPI003B51DB6C
MELGLFTMPSHPPERDLREGWEWDLQVIEWADEFGFGEAWIGEHHAAKWEPHPAPDLLTLEALRRTKNIRIGPGGFLLPYYHPAELANRISLLDHISEGRLNFGVAASGLPSDWEMFGVDGMAGENREMTQEAVEFILNMWTQEPGWTHEGKHWKGSVPHGMPDMELVHHLRPLQQPHPPIGVAGLNSPSPTLEMAGEKGWIPMSLNLNPQYVSGHWDSYEAGARRAGRDVSRSDWRMVREVFVAPTDEEAWELSYGGMMGRMMTDYFIPLLGAFDFHKFLIDERNPPAGGEVTVEYCARNNWFVGSPETVAASIEKVYADVGGFGHLLLFCFDYAETPESADAWRRSMDLLANDVMPRVAHLTGD